LIIWIILLTSRSPICITRRRPSGLFFRISIPPSRYCFSHKYTVPRGNPKPFATSITLAPLSTSLTALNRSASCSPRVAERQSFFSFFIIRHHFFLKDLFRFSDPDGGTQIPARMEAAEHRFPLSSVPVLQIRKKPFYLQAATESARLPPDGNYTMEYPLCQGRYQSMSSQP